MKRDSRVVVADELEQKEKKRHAVGLELRNALNKTHNLS
jgi:hypothetical protein